ncbi:hypothetical protein FQA39_LY00390 [Lamprigera yunnana]|nr:hypothetical protein FQA39_LY00390 [Lamprigera yunnana]
MPQDQDTGRNGNSNLPYIVGGLLGVAGAGIAYLLANASTESTQQTHPSNSTPSSSNYSGCSICRNGCTEAPRILPCGHKFHESCINRWLKFRSSCPQCHILVQ